MSKTKKKAPADSKLLNALNQIDKLYGKESFFRYGDGIQTDVKVISFGSLLINEASGIGGAPRGRIIEIYGPESSGKTTLCLHIIAEAQAAGGKVAFIDAEHALDPKYAKKIGVDMPNLYLGQPDYGEQALEITEKLTASGAFDVVVVDSVAALTPKSEIEGDMGDHQMGTHARLMSQALRKLTAIVSKSNTLLIFINQTRSKIGVVFGNPETTTGGNALKFYASQRIRMNFMGQVKEKEKVVANRTKVKFVKNKLSAPFTECEIQIRFGIGIDKIGEIIDISVDAGIVKKSGAWFVLKNKKWQGREKMREYLVENKKYVDYLLKKITGE